MKTLALLLGVVLTTAAALTAQVTHNVPASFPTIQAAINAAATGDTVLVAPGTYFENLQITGKDITLRGSAGASMTIVDGLQLGPVLRIGPFMTRATLVEGLTFQNGKGGDSAIMNANAQGGGIDIRLSAPTILRCDILNNEGGRASSGAIGGAGGILIRGLGNNPAGPAIRNCNIRNNLGGGALQTPGVPMIAHGGAGGIMLEESNMFARACIIESNTGAPSIGAPNFIGSSAGGIGIVLPDGMPIVADCEIHFNQGGDALPGATRAGAGGIGAGGAPLIDFCNIGNNVGGTTIPGNALAASAGAGGIFTVAANIVNTFVRDNQGGAGGPNSNHGGAGGIGMTGAAIVNDCVVGGNIGGDSQSNVMGNAGAGGIHSQGGNIVVLNTTIADNQGGDALATGNGAVGGLQVDGGSANVKNSILWNDIGGGNQQMQQLAPDEVGGSGATTITYSDVLGGFVGIGNINIDPNFVNALARDYHLAAGSPCIDAGIVGDPINTLKDIDGDPRNIGMSIDMGADEASLLSMPITGDDMSLQTLIGFSSNPDSESKYVQVGQIVEMRVFSPNACFNPADMYLVASPLITGAMPATVPGLVGFHLDPNNLIVLGPGPMPLYETSFGCGKAFFYQVAASFPGWSLWVQGFAFDASAANGWLAMSEAHELRFN